MIFSAIIDSTRASENAFLVALILSVIYLVVSAFEHDRMAVPVKLCPPLIFMAISFGLLAAQQVS